MTLEEAVLELKKHGINATENLVEELKKYHFKSYQETVDSMIESYKDSLALKEKFKQGLIK